MKNIPKKEIKGTIIDDDRLKKAIQTVDRKYKLRRDLYSGGDSKPVRGRDIYK